MVAHPPRLNVLLASDAPVGIVFRRGPSKMVRVFRWDREKDKFKPCSWFKGKIYADRSDLSPNGRYMIYFAMGGVAWAIPETGGTWTAISKVPSLTAIALWGQGDTWGGGGMFTSNRSYWLDADANTHLIRDTTELRRDSKRPAPSHEEHHGWIWTNKPKWDPLIRERPIAKGWSLVWKRDYPRNHYQLHHQEDGVVLDLPTWEWAEWDRHRIIWAEKGCLKAAKIGAHKLGTIRTLHDFNETERKQ